MAFKITFSAEALGQLKKLENDLIKRILKKLEQASSDPLNYFQRMIGREEYKLRIGDYRIIAMILHNEKTILIIQLGHRKNIYKKLK